MVAYLAVSNQAGPTLRWPPVVRYVTFLAAAGGSYMLFRPSMRLLEPRHTATSSMLGPLEDPLLAFSEAPQIGSVERESVDAWLSAWFVATEAAVAG